MKAHRLAAPCAVLATMAWGTTASAQDTLQPTAVQIELNDEAYDAFVAEDFAKAARLYRASLDIGPLNMTYANYGFALFRMGRCAEASEAYESASRAPKITDPPPSEVEATLEAYRGLLPQGCARISLECPGPGVEISLDGNPPEACDSRQRWIAPGQHAVKATVDGAPWEARFAVDAGQNRAITMAPVEATPSPVEPAPGEARWMGTAGLIAGGAGLASLLGGLFIEVGVLQPGVEELEELSAQGDINGFNARKDELAGSQTTAQILFIGGGLLTATGLVLYLLDEPAEQEPAAPQGLMPWLGPGYGAAFGGSF